MTQRGRLLSLAGVLSLLSPVAVLAQESPGTAASGSTLLEDVVVTAPRSVDPLLVVTDPKKPQQPIPAHDGAEYLKNIPGFSVIRKGGTDGDPILRGMAGSRLNILLDGQQIFGGCGNRMDPPTAYVFPESYDQVKVFKGPQSVLNGPGSSAGAVLFERAIKRFTTPGYRAQGSLTVGSFGRNDQVGDLRGGNADVYGQFTGTRTDARDYKDGGGRTIHSAYTRWSTGAALGWTPSDDGLIELSGIHSEGEAAYADRTMDGSKFDRDNVAFKVVKKNLSPLFKKVSGQLYYNYVDHVMDNYSLRTPGATFSAMNPDRTTTGGRLDATLAPDEKSELTVGVDFKRDEHTARSAMMQMSAAAADAAYRSASRDEDMRFSQFGIFAEGSRMVTEEGKVVAGLRVDAHEAKDSRNCVAATACAGNPNNTKGESDRETLYSGFGRYEQDLWQGGGKWYVGLGHAERTPDYWERLEGDPATSTAAAYKSAFLTTDPEKTNQVDAGLLWNSGPWSGSVAAFYGKIEDYLLIRWTPVPKLSRNIDATVMGGEGDLTYKLNDQWRTSLAVSYVRGENDTDDKPLAQQPPLEAKWGVEYDDKTHSAGAVWRVAARQDRLDVGSGNIVLNGADTVETPGFGVLSLHAGWRTSKETLLTAGVDNVLDKEYAEHLSRGGSAVPGYLVPTGSRVNEPGRTVWVKFSVDFE
ncbi:MAG: TonB-dependent copper receptor [Magnetococcales bacterium]|nr:TonB-dependent copper receptor [Magnetococcales bacterium]